MKHIIDLHAHSRYSRACSQNLTLPNIAQACKKKGISIVTTSDITHPRWFAHCQEELKEIENGVYALKNDNNVRFICGTEVACIYKQGGKVRRLHLLILFPSFTEVALFQKKLQELGCNITSDGRPILGISGIELLKIVKDISPNNEMIPAHAWTPWFSVFGSKSGFDSLQECFGEMTSHIKAIETGLSSDPVMNSELSQLDNIALISNSDAHGLENFGREANVFELENTSYKNIIDVMYSNDPNKFLHTIEFYPEEGKYHLDGHAPCKIHMTPQETKKRGGRCPACDKLVTVGVLSRVEELSDRKAQQRKIPHRYIVPLKEVIGESLGVGKASKKVGVLYEKMIGELGNEFHILLDEDILDIGKVSTPYIAEGIKRMREGNMIIDGGYDGIYGTVKIFKDREKISPQQTLL